jgi:flagellar secretion chaperone FliS
MRAMYARAQQRSSLQHYQDLSLSSRIEAAGPHELVAILYEELVGALDVVRTACERGQNSAMQRATTRTSSILIALEASLDLERGGDLARQLAGIYKTMQVQLSRAVHEQDTAQIATLRLGAVDLFTAWAQIGRPREI